MIKREMKGMKTKQRIILGFSCLLLLNLIFYYCEPEKELLHSWRGEYIEIKLDQNAIETDDGILVRNNVPVQIKVLFAQAKSNFVDVTWQAELSLAQPALGKIMVDSSRRQLTFIHEASAGGEQHLSAKFMEHSTAIDFTIAPLEVVAIPDGTFLMGSKNSGIDTVEERQHYVVLSGFKIGKYEVTNLEFSGFLQAHVNEIEINRADTLIQLKNNEPWLHYGQSKIEYFENNKLFKIQTEYENYPVVGVTWYGAYRFGEYYNLRLPTEAEWEYACRDTSTTTYFCGSSASCLRSYANFKPEVGYGSLDSVYSATQLPNRTGIFDIIGNAAEWCQDWYNREFYASDTMINPCACEGRFRNAANEKIYRGGHYNSLAEECRSAKRMKLPRYKSTAYIGFRVADDF